MTLELAGVSLTLPDGGAPLFQPVSLIAQPGQIVTLMGPSGIGKSTLLDHIGGHLAPDVTVTGRLLLNGTDLSGLAPEARRIGMLFQDATLFPHLSVGANLAFGLVRGTRTERQERVDAALGSVGLAGFRNRDPATLSGGERTRVALMRTLLAGPRAVLLDEPFSKLDQSTRAEVRALVIEHVRAAGIPALMVTHDPADAAATGGPVITLR